MYKSISLTSKGCENIASSELKELIKPKKIEIESCVVKFETSNLMDICKACYKMQSASRVFLLLSEFVICASLDESTKSIRDAFEESDFSEWLIKEKSFKIVCQRQGIHDFSSVDLDTEAAKALLSIAEKKYTCTLNTDFDNPELIFYLFVNQDKGYFGIDFSGIDLSKRQYKIFNHPESLKGTTGFCLVKEAGFNKKKTMIDPFMGSGIILIEAGLYALGLSPHYYTKDRLAFVNFEFFKEYGAEKFFKALDPDSKNENTNIFGFDSQLKYLKACQKNAKLAGIDKQINLSKVEAEWLDTKFDKGSVDMIITDPPRQSRKKEEHKLRKTYHELFYQAEYILKKTGTITLIAKEYGLFEEEAEKHKFKIKKQYAIYQGKEEFNIITLGR